MECNRAEILSFGRDFCMTSTNPAATSRINAMKSENKNVYGNFSEIVSGMATHVERRAHSPHSSRQPTRRIRSGFREKQTGIFSHRYFSIAGDWKAEAEERFLRNRSISFTPLGSLGAEQETTCGNRCVSKAWRVATSSPDDPMNRDAVNMI